MDNITTEQIFMEMKMIHFFLCHRVLITLNESKTFKRKQNHNNTRP